MASKYAETIIFKKIKITLQIQNKLKDRGVSRKIFFIIKNDSNHYFKKIISHKVISYKYNFKNYEQKLSSFMFILEG